MKTLQLSRIRSGEGSDPSSLASLQPLLEALRSAGLRWSHLSWSPSEPPAELPESLASILGRGAHKVVSIGAEGSVVAKSLAGPAVFRDVLREHFRGQDLVLIEGQIPEGVEAPWIEALPDGRVRIGEGADARDYEAAELVAELRRPHPFSEK